MQLPAWTYTFLSDDENCPAKAWHKHVAKDLPREEKTPAQTWGIEVHKALEYRLRERKPFPPEMSACEPYALAIEQMPGTKLVEEWLQITADGSKAKPFAADVWGKGRVDTAILHSNVGIIFDWKTGKPNEDPLELETQALMLKCFYPGLTHVRGHYVWLRERRIGPAHDLSDFGRTFNDVKVRWRDITSRPLDTEWVKKPNPLCGWCPVMTCEHNRVEKRNGKA